jgi:geranylgeranyl diphosphate synthase type II
MLREYGDVTRVALCEYLRPREPQRHLYSLVADYPRRGGRMLRPSLVIATARAFGAPLEHAVKTAVALELLHNAFLIHDDVEDRSELRRGRPTLHSLHGVPAAVNAGDTLLLLGVRALVDNARLLGPSVTLRLLEEAERMARETAEGQAIELGWRRDNPTYLTDEDYLQMVFRKTCWYTTVFPLRAGALIAGQPPPVLDSLLRIGLFLGAAFQIQDDILNLEGDERIYGKEIGGDLREGKRTLMMIDLLRSAAPSAQQWLVGVLAEESAARATAASARIRTEMDAIGAIPRARRLACALAGAALSELAPVADRLADSADLRMLRELPTWVLERR